VSLAVFVAGNDGLRRGRGVDADPPGDYDAIEA
jgi:hypothetical protein